MFHVTNRTPFKVNLAVLPDLAGVDSVLTIVKGTFTLNASTPLAEEQVAISFVDEWHGEPGTSSVRVPSDVSIGKPGTDLLLVGTACAPGDRPSWQMDVLFAVGPVVKTIRVFGDRVWNSTGAGAAVSWVTPFVRMPLVWERAFGGVDETNAGTIAEPRNPVGRGFRSNSSTRSLSGLPLPNLEDPSALISSWTDRPAPVAFGPTGRHWLPRQTFAGTYDENWNKTRAPYLPSDFDPRFFHAAPSGLATTTHLRGGEIVNVRGVVPEGDIHFALPALRIQATYRFDAGVEIREAALDTVLVESDARRFIIVWSTALRCDKRALKVREVEVTATDSSAYGGSHERE